MDIVEVANVTRDVQHGIGGEGRFLRNNLLQQRVAKV